MSVFQGYFSYFCRVLGSKEVQDLDKIMEVVRLFGSGCGSQFWVSLQHQMLR